MSIWVFMVYLEKAIEFTITTFMISTLFSLIYMGIMQDEYEEFWMTL